MRHHRAQCNVGRVASLSEKSLHRHHPYPFQARQFVVSPLRAARKKIQSSARECQFLLTQYEHTALQGIHPQYSLRAAVCRDIFNGRV
jgi:hypothetical protein